MLGPGWRRAGPGRDAGPGGGRGGGSAVAHRRPAGTSRGIIVDGGRIEGDRDVFTEENSPPDPWGVRRPGCAAALRSCAGRCTDQTTQPPFADEGGESRAGMGVPTRASPWPRWAKVSGRWASPGR
jgi:hypothetical protein